MTESDNTKRTSCLNYGIMALFRMTVQAKSFCVINLYFLVTDIEANKLECSLLHKNDMQYSPDSKYLCYKTFLFATYSKLECSLLHKNVTKVSYFGISSTLEGSTCNPTYSTSQKKWQEHTH